VLHVTRLTDRTGAYYLADLATELGPVQARVAPDRPGSPRSPDAGRPGRWLGAGAGGLGLTGPVAEGDLRAVLAGRVPATGRSLVARRGAVGGYDLTFTAPKSVSVLLALGPPDVAREVLAAHIGAVGEAMSYVAQRAVGVSRTEEGERLLQPVGGVVGAAFVHGVSRALDPHLHTHVVVANVGHGPDGRWTALDGRGIFAHGPAAGHLYDAALRHRLAGSISVEWRLRRSGSYEIAGIPPAVIGAFSSRQAEIRSHLAELTPTGSGERDRPASPRASRIAWASTREAKVPNPTPHRLIGRWAARAGEWGLDAADLSVVTGRSLPSSPVVDEHRFAASLVTSPHAAATRRQVVAAWARSLAGGSPVADVERCADRLADWGDAVGVAEPRRPPADVVPPSHALAALGPRPSSPAALEVWLEGSAAIDAYRRRWAPAGERGTFEVEASGKALAAMGPRQLADHLATSRRVDDARRRLGRAFGRVPETPSLALGRG